MKAKEKKDVIIKMLYDNGLNPMDYVDLIKDIESLAPQSHVKGEKDSMGRNLPKALTPKEISYKYANGHLACTREINRLIKSYSKQSHVSEEEIEKKYPVKNPITESCLANKWRQEGAKWALDRVSKPKERATECPECGCKDYINENSLGKGFRNCKECKQEWWTDIDYSKPSPPNQEEKKEEQFS